MLIVSLFAIFFVNTDHIPRQSCYFCDMSQYYFKTISSEKNENVI